MNVYLFDNQYWWMDNDDVHTYRMNKNGMVIVKQQTTSNKRNGKRANVRTGSTVPTVPTSMDDAIAIAKTITRDNIIAVVTAANVNHGVTIAMRNRSRFTGTRVADTQNTVLRNNATVKLTDTQIAGLFAMLFPMAPGAVFTGSIDTRESIVRGIRAHFNRDGHGGEKPTVPSDEYDTNGNVVTVRPRVRKPVPAVLPSDGKNIPLSSVPPVKSNLVKSAKSGKR